MRISRKIGISFFITFLLVIILGAVSIYSLRHIYRGLNQVFTRDLPASRSTYQVGISMESLFSELNNFLITRNENFRPSYDRSYRKIQDYTKELERFIVEEEEKVLFEDMRGAAGEINAMAQDIFEKNLEMKGLFKELRSMEVKYRKKLGQILAFEENKMTGEKDLLLIQAQYIPSSQLIMDAGVRFSDLLDGLANYVASDSMDASSSFMGDLLALDKPLREYKNFHGYSISEKERTLTTELIDLSGEIKTIADSMIDIKKKIDESIGSLMIKEKEFIVALDKLLALKKSGISSKLGVGATLTEDIPAIHNISKIEKDMTGSWRVSGRYVLTGDEAHKNTYYQLRQNIDKALKDYERHARLRGTEKYLDEIVDSEKEILELIDSNMEIFDRKRQALLELVPLKADLEKEIRGLLKHNDSLVKKGQSPSQVLEKDVPARWALIKLRQGLSNASQLLMDYLYEQEAQYKDLYSGLYFDMKKDLNRFRTLSASDKARTASERIEKDLDRFNAVILSVFESQDVIVRERGWTLVKLQEGLKEKIDRAVEVEISQIDKNKEDIKKRIAVVNTLIFFIIGVVAAIAAFVILYTTRSITRPIQELYDGAEVIGSGNLDHRLDIKTGDEIQDLAEGFNRMAGELKGLYTNLENKVKERTQQLAEANKLLGVKNKELDDFTYIVSHDLKEPLRGVKAFTKLLMEEYSGKLDKEGKEHLKTISESSTRMTALIEDLLNLSRIGRIKNIEPNIDMNEVLSDVKKNLQYSLEEKKVDLKIAGDFPKVTCDRIRISEVFSNLISNAIKYSKKGVKPVVEVGFSDKADFYEFYVKDNGIGIEKEYHDKVFQIFQRLHAKGSEYEGTGAGLTIVKKIVENHNGKIWVESGPGQGSTFKFTLPKKG